MFINIVINIINTIIIIIMHMIISITIIFGLTRRRRSAAR